MGPPDVRAFNEYVQASKAGGMVTVVPRYEHGPTKQFLHMDASAYAKGTPSQQNEARDIFVQHLEDVGSGESSIKAAQDLLNHAKTDPIYANEAGGMAFPERGFVFTDDRSIKMGDQIREVMRGEPVDMAQMDVMKARMTKLHEASHIMLRTGEAGSDFMAAAVMLRDNPESRPMVRAEADLRMVYGLQRGPLALSLYGVECHDAIERALSMTPEQLKNADMETLYGIASDFDFVNDMNANDKEKSPEGRALAKISEYTGKGRFDGSLKKAWQDATLDGSDPNEPTEQLRYTFSSPTRMIQALRENPSTDPEDRKIADKLEASVGRLNAYVTGPERAAPKPVVAPEHTQ